MDIDKVFKALADKTRRLIVDVIAQRDNQTLFEITAKLTTDHGLNITRQGISKHLKILEDAQLIDISWSGKSKLHSLNPTPLKEINKRWISKHERK